MPNLLRTAAAAATVAATGFLTAPSQAHAYQIDCAILLCLSGGWPASAPCTAARAEFIRRITPWPVEPPLQIWRCPMGVSYSTDPDAMTVDQLWDVLLDNDTFEQSFPAIPLSDPDATMSPQPAVLRRETGGAAMPLPDGSSIQLVDEYINEEGSSDIDISSPAFNFVRSIRVYMVNGMQSESNNEHGDCHRYSGVRLGSYGTQGDYAWHASSIEAVPPSYSLPSGWGANCPSVSIRSVFVDWRDYEGNYGWERVDY